MPVILPLLISLGFYINNVSDIYNYILAGFSILIVPNFINKNTFGRLNIFLLSLLIISLLIYRLTSNTFINIINTTDFAIIFVSVIFSFFLSKLTYIRNFLKINWYFGLIVWFAYFLGLLYRNYFNINLFLSNSQNNVLSDLYKLSGGLIYKPLISMLLILPIIILIYSQNNFKNKILFCPRINGFFLKLSILLMFVFIVPSRAMRVAFIISFVLDLLFYFLKNKKILNIVSFGIPSIILSSIFILRILANYFHEILFADPRVYLWITSGYYLFENPLSFFIGPGYTLVDDIITNNINLSKPFLDILDKNFKLVPLDTPLSAWFRIDLLDQNLGFESDFINGFIGFGCLTFILLMGFVLKKILSLMYFDKEKLYTNNRYEIVVFARYMLIIILSTIFEDKGAYIVLWILIFTILSINLIDNNESKSSLISKFIFNKTINLMLLRQLFKYCITSKKVLASKKI